VIRLDSTVTAAPIHTPSDSSLLFDAVRVCAANSRWASRWWSHFEVRTGRNGETLSGGRLAQPNIAPIIPIAAMPIPKTTNASSFSAAPCSAATEPTTRSRTPECFVAMCTLSSRNAGQ
jgi:hypothetical protein